MLALLLFATMLTAADEKAVTTAVLEAYFHEVHGGDAIAFREQRRPVLLHRKTIVPTHDKLEVRVYSPANDARQYAGARSLIADLRDRSSHPVTVRKPPESFQIGTAQLHGCGPDADMRKFADAVAISRPGFDGRDRALLYVESPGAARAYGLQRVGETWRVLWHVELWACG